MITEKITNPTNLPEIIVKWAEQSDRGYTGNDFAGLSVTTLISPGYQRHLRNKYVGEVNVPVASKLWAMLGTAIHSILENIEGDQYVKEERIHATVDGMVVHGQFDCLDTENKTLYDFKVTSKYTVAGGKSKIEWEQQMNILAYLLRKEGHIVEHLSIIGIFRDHMFKDKFEHQLPKEAIQEIKLPVWNDDKILAFVKERIKAHLTAEPCSQEERWQDDTKYAVMERGKKRAIRLYNTSTEAQGHVNSIITLNKPVYVEKRMGEPTRCDKYCSVNQYCAWYKQYLITAPKSEIEND